MGRNKSGYLDRLQSSVNRQMDARLDESRENLGQFHLAAMMIAAHNVLGVGPGRAKLFLEEYVRVKYRLSVDLVKDIGTSKNRSIPKKDRIGDEDYWKTREEMFNALKPIFWKDWRKVQDLWPMLSYYWETAADETVEGQT